MYIYYNNIQNKACFILGFVNRNCIDFNNPIALKALYC